MSKRRVRISFPGNVKPQEVQSDAKTWGELKNQIASELGSSFDNTKVRDFTTKHHYDDDGAVLPEGEIKLLVSTDKNKSGMPVTKANYKNASYSDLRTFCKKVTGFGPNGKDLCLEALDAHYNGGSTPAPKKEVAKKEVAKKIVAKKTETVKASVKVAKPISSLEARVKKLEDVIFGDDEEDAEYLAAVRNNQ